VKRTVKGLGLRGAVFVEGLEDGIGGGHGTALLRAAAARPATAGVCLSEKVPLSDAEMGLP
jgi:hypothetical protein